MLIASYLLGIFLGALDMGIVSPALPAIGRSLDLGNQRLVYVVTVYTLVYALAMPILGKLADRYGRKRVFQVGLLLFGLGSLLALFSPNGYWLLVGRGVQALGGGGIVPVATAEIAVFFPPARRGTALGMVGAVFGLASLIGPNVGGLILQHGIWQDIFALNLPLVLLVLLLSSRLPTVPGNGEGSLDLISPVLLGLGFFLVMVAIDDWQPSRLGAWVPAGIPLLLGGLVLLGFLWWREKQGRSSFLAPAAWQAGAAPIFLMAGCTGATMAAMVYVPLYGQEVLKLSQGASGYALTPMAVGGSLLAGLSGAMVDRWGARPVLVTGLGLAAAGALALPWWGNMVGFLLCLLVLGLGMGLTMGAPVNYLLLSLVPNAEAGAGLAVVGISRSLGATIGPTLMASVLPFGWTAVFAVPFFFALLGGVCALAGRRPTQRM